MKKTLLLLFLIAPLMAGAQKVKIKKGKVFVDKKETLQYESTKLGTVYKTLDGKNLFRFKKESMEKENPNKNGNNTINRDAERLNELNSNQSDPIRRGDRYEKKTKINYIIVSFYDLKLEYETTMSASKIIREFYKKKVLMEDGLFNPGNAQIVAKKMAKDLTGTRKLGN